MLELSESNVALLEPLDVAKAKAQPPEPEPVKSLFTVKGKESWYAWLKAYAKFRGVSSVTVLLDQMARDDARRNGFDEPMPPRV